MSKFKGTPAKKNYESSDEETEDEFRPLQLNDEHCILLLFLRETPEIRQRESQQGGNAWDDQAALPDVPEPKKANQDFGKRQ